MKVWTIGFTKKTAERFFDLISRSGTKRIVDVRLNNKSQLSGFAKHDDLAFFLSVICGIEYVHVPELAPTPEILADYRKGRIDWPTYESRFLALMAERKVEQTTLSDVIADGCLLCSEDTPHHCHRRLVADYLSDHWGDVEVHHLGAD